PRCRKPYPADRVLQLAHDSKAAICRPADVLLVERPVARRCAARCDLCEQGRTRIEEVMHEQNLRLARRGRSAQGFNPSSWAIGLRASRTFSTCSSKGMPSDSAPATSSSRCTPRAKALSFIFLRTVF